MSLKNKTIQNFAFQNDLWQKEAKIIVGVSGGPDSVCLLDILCKLAPKYAFGLEIAHVNYGLRGKDSKLDEKFVRSLAELYNLKIHVLNPKKELYKGNLENSLRKIRYDFFEEIRKKEKFGLIAVAHNQDDQAETVLMRIFRGSGLHGLSAMKAKSGKIIRPLLQTSKEEILAYLKTNKLEYRIDKTNLATKFTRNRLRGDFIPYLEKNFNPKIKKTLGEWSLHVADDYDFIFKQAERISSKICKNKCTHFEIKDILSQHPALQRQILRNIFLHLKGSTDNLENKQVEELLKILKSNKGKNQKSFIGGLNIYRKGGKVEIFC